MFVKSSSPDSFNSPKLSRHGKFAHQFYLLLIINSSNPNKHTQRKTRGGRRRLFARMISHINRCYPPTASKKPSTAAGSVRPETRTCWELQRVRLRLGSASYSKEDRNRVLLLGAERLIGVCNLQPLNFNRPTLTASYHSAA